MSEEEPAWWDDLREEFKTSPFKYCISPYTIEIVKPKIKYRRVIKTWAF